jgi:CheY-like chemotaxis protein
MNAPPGLLFGKHVLIVEDEYLVALDLTRAVEACGALVVGPAGNVRQALAIIASGAHFDVALLDVNLGDERITAVAEAVRSKGVPIVFQTGYSSSHLPESFLDCAILLKPTDPAELVRTVAEAIVQAE